MTVLPDFPYVPEWPGAESIALRDDVRSALGAVMPHADSSDVDVLIDHLAAHRIRLIRLAA